MPQRRSSRQAAYDVNEAMKSQLLAEGGSGKSRVCGAPKRQAIGSPQVGEFESSDAVYLPKSESESEDENMCVLSDDEGPAFGPSNKISTNDWDDEQHTTLSMRKHTNSSRPAPPLCMPFWAELPAHFCYSCLKTLAVGWLSDTALSGPQSPLTLS